MGGLGRVGRWYPPPSHHRSQSSQSSHYGWSHNLWLEPQFWAGASTGRDRSDCVRKQCTACQIGIVHYCGCVSTGYYAHLGGGMPHRMISAGQWASTGMIRRDFPVGLIFMVYAAQIGPATARHISKTVQMQCSTCFALFSETPDPIFGAARPDFGPAPLPAGRGGTIHWCGLLGPTGPKVPSGF